MRATQTLLAAFVAVAVSATSTTLFKNYCPNELFLTLNNSPALELPPGAARTANIVGKGNTAILTKTEDVFDPQTPKMVLGTSTDAGVLYWSLSAQNGDPFGPAGQRFNISTGGLDAAGVAAPNVCQNATTYDGLVHACQDSGAVILTVFACPFNAAA